MKTCDDIVDDEQLDLSLQVLGIEARPEHAAVVWTVHCRDIADHPVRINYFENSVFDPPEWTLGGWYTFENVVGDVYRGETSLKFGFDTTVSRRSEPDESEIGPVPGTPPSLTIAADIADNEPLHITAKVTGEQSVDSEEIATKVTLEDVASTEFDLTVFIDDDSVANVDWEGGQWYRLGSVLGDVFRGQPGATPTSSTEVFTVEPPMVATEAADGAPDQGDGAETTAHTDQGQSGREGGQSGGRVSQRSRHGVDTIEGQVNVWDGEPSSNGDGQETAHRGYDRDEQESDHGRERDADTDHAVAVEYDSHPRHWYAMFEDLDTVDEVIGTAMTDENFVGVIEKDDREIAVFSAEGVGTVYVFSTEEEIVAAYPAFDGESYQVTIEDGAPWDANLGANVLLTIDNLGTQVNCFDTQYFQNPMYMEKDVQFKLAGLAYYIFDKTGDKLTIEDAIGVEQEFSFESVSGFFETDDDDAAADDIEIIGEVVASESVQFPRTTINRYDVLIQNKEGGEIVLPVYGSSKALGEEAIEVGDHIFALCWIHGHRV